ncbi:HvfC/BufC N-terminal domain-containing protein [Sphingomonas mali]|uniref:HvfC/BufC N-terminal domain-containing protein n=1 Tax=Sphingomonas mali TaxID=40682 RepID=UPI00082D37C2|nr:DNA-binding domain-containing protein [Sphingomonas mali]
MLDAQSFQRAFAGLLAAPDKAPDPAIRRALTIHRNTASKAARDALLANYPVTAALVGEAPFAACAASYVEMAPPREARLCCYGDRFAPFVEAWVPFAEAPYLGAVAALERLVTEALFAKDMATLDPAALTEGIDTDARLQRHPATRTLRAASPAASLWLAHQSDAHPDALETVHWRPEIILVTRPADAVEIRVIDQPTYAFLAGATLARAAGHAAAAGGDVATIFASLLIAGAFAARASQGARP